MIQEKKKEYIRALKFLLFSISAGVVQVAIYYLIRLIAPFPEKSWQDYVVAYTPSLLCSVIWNFTINKKFTFQSAKNVKIAMLLVLAFYAVFAPASIILGGICVDGGMNPDLVFVLTMVVNFVTEFLYQRFFVFKNSLDTAVKKDVEEQAEVEQTEDKIEA